MTANAGESGVVFKILPARDWAQACVSGTIAPSAADLRDGFVHLSCDHQVAVTARRHFSGIAGLAVVALDASRLGSALRWEPSRDDEAFPHYYGQLPVKAALWARAMPLGADGAPLWSLT